MGKRSRGQRSALNWALGIMDKSLHIYFERLKRIDYTVQGEFHAWDNCTSMGISVIFYPCKQIKLYQYRDNYLYTSIILSVYTGNYLYTSIILSVYKGNYLYTSIILSVYKGKKLHLSLYQYNYPKRGTPLLYTTISL